MIEFTCCECGHKYTDATGDTEERMCNDCMSDKIGTIVIQCNAERCIHNHWKECGLNEISIDKFVYCDQHEEEE